MSTKGAPSTIIETIDAALERIDQKRKIVGEGVAIRVDVTLMRARDNRVLRFEITDLGIDSSFDQGDAPARPKGN